MLATEREIVFDDRIINAYHSNGRFDKVVSLLNDRIKLDPANTDRYKELIKQIKGELVLFSRYATLRVWVLKLGTKRTNVCVSPASGGLCVFLMYNYCSFFLCVGSGRTHKDIRLELAPLSARGRKFF